MQDNLARQLEPYQDERPVEIINGRVVMMAGTTVNHHRIMRNITRIFFNYLHGRPCEPFGDGVNLYLPDGDRYIPDFMVVCDRNKIRDDGIHGAPDLVVEVLSPSTARNDRYAKKNAYERSGVKEYWIVSPGDKTIEVYLNKDGKMELDATYSVYPDYMFPHLVSEEERAAIPVSFQCSLFDDLDIRLEDVFYRVV